MAKKDDDDDGQIKTQPSQTAKTVETGMGVESGATIFEQRNVFLLPDKQKELDQLQNEFAGYALNRDTGKVTDVQGNQDEILKLVANYLKENKDERGIFEAVKTLFSKEGIVWTDQLNKLGIRLIRLYELQRQGTTDLMEMPTAKDALKEHSMDLLKFYKGVDKQKAMFVLKNVENSQTGTTELGLNDLELTREMVRAALRNELVTNYQIGLDPQKLQGPQGDMQRIKTDVSPKVILYLRLLESLSIAIIKQQEITQEKEIGLASVRKDVLNSLDKLGSHSEIGISPETRSQFVNKMSVMNLDELKFFSYKILELQSRLNKQEVSAENANLEIMGWLAKKFNRQELQEDLQNRKKHNSVADEEELNKLRAA